MKEEATGFGLADPKHEGSIDPYHQVYVDMAKKRQLIQPNGFYVLIEMVEVKNVSEGGILLGDVRKEQDACDVGYVRAVGNTAFVGMPGCNPSDYPPSHEYFSKTPYQIWGIDIGDKVEYRRHEGKVSAIKGCEKLRYIPDTQIIGKVL